ncbi:MAG: UDP-glucose/GDP-mannose dehydrogenase family protein [Candidatus Diapherotrites archaeon]
MNVTVVGTGYVGLVSGVGLALKGHKVYCYDNNKDKIELIRKGKSPIFEEGLEEAIQKTLNKNLFPVTDLNKALNDSDASFICVGTPCDDAGKCDLSFVKSVAMGVGNFLKNSSKFHIVVIKSTVVPGTTMEEVKPLLEESSGKKAGRDFGLCMNPEFLREGVALDDFLKPDRIVVGVVGEKEKKVMKELYSNFNSHILFTDPTEAEMIKYASNSFLSTKISFINEIGNMCKALNIDVYRVAEGMGLDKRIGRHFLNAGLGWGGSCFPKDVSALISKAKELGLDASLLESVVKVNEGQPNKLIELAKKKHSLKGKRVGLLGLAFKPGTDDVRESRAIKIIEALNKEGAIILAHDPQAEENMKKFFPELNYFDSAQKLVKESEIIFVVTEWPHFSKLDFKGKPVFDGRRIFKEKFPKNYTGICW